MHCKNCNTTLKETAKFCDACGGKVIKHRLDFKTVAGEFFETIISWDNKFFKTFSHLITKPQEVANGYLEGIRKRYMQPFSYMLVVLSIYGIYLMLSKSMMLEYAETMKESLDKFSNVSKNNNFDFIKIMKFLQKNSTVFIFSIIPIFAFINKIIFRKRNFIEHIILLLYSMGTVMIISNGIGFLGIIFKINYGYINKLSDILMILYSIYYYKKIFDLDIWEIILKTLYFWLLLIPIYLSMIVVAVIWLVVIS